MFFHTAVFLCSSDLKSIVPGSAVQRVFPPQIAPFTRSSSPRLLATITWLPGLCLISLPVDRVVAAASLVAAVRFLPKRGKFVPFTRTYPC